MNRIKQVRCIDLKIVRYGKEYPAIKDNDIPVILETFVKKNDVLETNSHLIIYGVRSLICQKKLSADKVEFQFVDTNEKLFCNEDGKFPYHPSIFGSDLEEEYLNILIGL